MALAGAGPEAVEPLTHAVRDRDPKVRGGADRVVETLGARAKAAVPALIEALADPEPPDDPKPPRGPSFDDWQREGEPRPSGYYAALRAIGPPAVSVVLERLNAPDRPARIAVLRALGFLGDDAKSAVPRLIALLSSPPARGDWREPRRRLLTLTREGRRCSFSEDRACRSLRGLLISPSDLSKGLFENSNEIMGTDGLLLEGDGDLGPVNEDDFRGRGLRLGCLCLGAGGLSDGIARLISLEAVGHDAGRKPPLCLFILEAGDLVGRRRRNTPLLNLSLDVGGKL
jgi:hypothetical protein